MKTRKRRVDFRKQSSEVWYDLEYDRELIIQSIAKQYGVLPSQQKDLPYRDWISLVSGIMEDTPLGQIVLIRKENDKDRIKHFTHYEHNIRNEWRRFRAGQKNKADTEKSIAALEDMFRNMFKKGG